MTGTTSATVSERTRPRLPVPRRAEEDQKRHARRAKELVIFLLFGGTAALANLLAGWMLYGAGLLPGLPYWGATAIAAAVGLTVNFALNYTFNFKFRHRSAFQQFSTFCAVSGIGIVLTSALSNGVLNILEHQGTFLIFHDTEAQLKFAAHVVAVGLVAVYSFPAHKCFSFNVGICARLQQLRRLIAE